MPMTISKPLSRKIPLPNSFLRPINEGTTEIVVGPNLIDRRSRSRWVRYWHK
jgi:hypothetical protein